MKTILDNNQKIFQIVTSTGKQAFCNFDDLNRTVESLETHEGYFKIYHFWNNKPKLVTKKFLKEMYKGARITQLFYY